MFELNRSSMLGKATMLAAVLGLFTGAVHAQDNIQAIMENIRPVGQVCLAGQDCNAGTGGQSGSAASTAAPVSTTTQAPPPAPATTPAATAAPAADTAAPAFDVAASYQQFCFACHGTGAAGAPVLGDTEAWDARLENGMETVVANAMNGLNAMPAKGLCMTCTEDNIRALISYMIEGGQ